MSTSHIVVKHISLFCAGIIITDITGKRNTYGSSYHLDKLINDNWKTLKVIYDGNYVFTSLLP